MARHDGRRELGVGPKTVRRVSHRLTRASADDPLTNGPGGFRHRRCSSERAEDVRGQGRHVDRQIQAIAKRTGKTTAIAGHLLRRAAALARRIRREAARARIHRAHQNEARGKHRRARRARDDDAAVLERLAQHLEHVAAELEHLVEKEDAVMGEADLARARLSAAANQRDVGDGVMRRAKGTIGEQAGAARQEAGD